MIGAARDTIMDEETIWGRANLGFGKAILLTMIVTLLLQGCAFTTPLLPLTPTSSRPISPTSTHTPVSTEKPELTGTPFLASTPTPTPLPIVSLIRLPPRPIHLLPLPTVEVPIPTPMATTRLGREGRVRIAFTKDNDREIWTMALDGSQMRLVVKCEDDTGLNLCEIGIVRGSPDGKKMAYAYYPEGLAGYGQETVLAYVNVSDGEETTLLKRDGPSISSLVWSPDSAKLAFSEWNQRKEPSNEHGTWLIDLCIGQCELLLPWVGSEWGSQDVEVVFANVGWSPDENFLVVLIGSAAPEGESIIGTYIAGRAGGELKLIKSGCSLAGWSPDRKRILFNCSQPQGTEIWMTNADGAEGLCLTPEGIEDTTTNNSWSPDGKHLLVLSIPERDFYLWPCIPYHLWLVSADGNDRRQLTFDDDFCEGSAFWSPDGTRIIFQRYQRDMVEGKQSHPWSVWSISPDGSDLKKLADGKLCDIFVEEAP